MPTILETNRLLVRPWTDTDAAAVFAILGDPQVTRYLGDSGAAFTTLDACAEWLQRINAKSEQWEPLGSWAVIERATETVIGGGGLLELESGPDVEVYYHFRRDRWGLGYATELARALIVYGFAVTDLSCLVAVVYPENTASQRVLTKAGMTHLGRRRAYDADLEFFIIDRPTQ